MIATDQIAETAAMLAESKHVIAMTGAGMSVESGIPTFRGEDGMWKRHGTPAPDSYGKWLKDPESWWSRERVRAIEPWVAELRSALDAARPNNGHIALADMESLGTVRTVVTQNIDGLHQEAGSKSVIEIHGSRYKLRCIECGDRTPRTELFMTNPPPPCQLCGGRIKFDSVLFGEPIPPKVLESARAAADAADCVITIGTSASVRPAGGLPRIAQANGAKLIEINPAETSLSKSCDIVIRGSAAEVLPRISAALTSDQIT